MYICICIKQIIIFYMGYNDEIYLNSLHPNDNIVFFGQLKT